AVEEVEDLSEGLSFEPEESTTTEPIITREDPVQLPSDNRAKEEDDGLSFVIEDTGDIEQSISTSPPQESAQVKPPAPVEAGMDFEDALPNIQHQLEQEIDQAFTESSLHESEQPPVVESSEVHTAKDAANHPKKAPSPQFGLGKRKTGSH